MLRKNVSVAILSIAVASPSFLFAATEPQSIDMGVGKLIPLLKITQKYDDNIFSQAVNEKSSQVTQFAPVIQFLAEKDADYYALTYTGDYGAYWDSSDDNYDDHTLSFDASMSPTSLYTVNFGASSGKLHDNRGEGSSEGVVAGTRPKPDEYNLNSANILFDFGRDSAILALEVEAAIAKTDYTTNESLTKFRDRTQTTFAARLYNKPSDRTKFFLGYSNKDNTYVVDPIVGPSLDSINESYRFGAEWEATGKTTGTVSFGRLTKDFDASIRGSSADLWVWNADIVWSPRTYSNVFFSASKDARETNGTGSFIEEASYSVNWVHSWTDVLNTNLGFSLGDDKYEQSAREDDRSSFSMGVDYDFRRWANVGLSYQYSERDSNINTFDYKKNTILVTFDLSM